MYYLISRVINKYQQTICKNKVVFLTIFFFFFPFLFVDVGDIQNQNQFETRIIQINTIIRALKNIIIF